MIRTTSDPRKYVTRCTSTWSCGTNVVARIYYLRHGKNTGVLGPILVLVVVTRISRLETIKTGFDRSRERRVGCILREQTIRRSFGFNASYTYVSTTLRRSSTITIGRSGRP